MFLRLATALAVTLLCTFSAQSAEEKLVVLGTHLLDLEGNGAAIDVSKAAGAYAGIRVRAKSGKGELTRIQVIYADGSVYEEDRRISLKSGERTRPIDEGRDRFIDTVNVINAPGRGKMLIDVLGIQTASGATMKRQAPATGDLTAAGSGSTAAEDRSEVLFGYQNVAFGIDRDVIKVGGDLGKFARIRLRVLGNDVHINAIKVVYVDGESEPLAVDADIKANSRSRWLDLAGGRFIREIQLSYRSRPNFLGHARIEVTGQYADGWLGRNGEGRRYNAGWVLLGAQTAGFTGFDRDLVPVGENEGGFSRLRVEALERAITLREVRVKFFSGPDKVFTMNERVDPGRPFGPLEFPTGSAPIKAVEAKYRSRFDLLKNLRRALDGEPAVVQIWGQH